MAGGGGGLRAAEVHFRDEAGGSATRKVCGQLGLGGRKRRQGREIRVAVGGGGGGGGGGRGNTGFGCISRGRERVGEGNFVGRPVVIVMVVFGRVLG